MVKIGDKPYAPLFAKKVVFHGLKFYLRTRILTSGARIFPNYIVIGAQRCGTTSLYRNLIKHPCIAFSLFKETNFFDENFENGIRWYLAHFPSISYRNYVKKLRGQDIVTGEASPNYFFHPHVPSRIFETVPKVKLIVMLRNPVERAYSHFWHEVKAGAETLSFDDAINREEKRLQGEMQRMLDDKSYYSFNYNHYSYLSRGIYVDQLKTWMKFFPQEQILVINSADFYKDSPRIFIKVLEFLNLPNWLPKEFKRFNVGQKKEKMSSATRQRLIEFFEPHNKRLYSYLGKDFAWNY